MKQRRFFALGLACMLLTGAAGLPGCAPKEPEGPAPVRGDILAGEILGTSAGNLANGGLALRVGDVWYYADGASLFQEGFDRTAQTRLQQDGARWLNTDGAWIYYSSQSDGGQVIRVQMDGADRTLLLEDNASCLTLREGFLYYRSGNDHQRLTRAAVQNGTAGEPQRLGSRRTDSLAVLGEWLYYTAGQKLYAARLDGSGERLIARGTFVGLQALPDGRLVYGSGKGIFAMEPDGSGVTQLGGDTPLALLAAEGNLWIIRQEGKNGKEQVVCRLTIPDPARETELSPLRWSAAGQEIRRLAGTETLYSIPVPFSDKAAWHVNLSGDRVLCVRDSDEHLLKEFSLEALDQGAAARHGIVFDRGAAAAFADPSFSGGWLYYRKTADGESRLFRYDGASTVEPV